MDEKTQKIINDHLEKLPPYIRESLKHIPWANEILQIGKRYGIHVDQMGTLQLETMMVLVGIVHPDEYPKSLRQELNLPEETINNVVREVNERILKTIRQELIAYIEQQNNQTETIFEKTGIELDPEAIPTVQREIQIGTTVAPMERDILEHSGVDVSIDTPQIDRSVESSGTIDRKEMLADIEHPPKNTPNQFSHLISTKLSNATITQPEKTRYNEARPTPPKPPERKANDPYREAI
jgi:hypothetical protein